MHVNSHVEILNANAYTRTVTAHIWFIVYHSKVRNAESCHIRREDKETLALQLNAF